MYVPQTYDNNNIFYGRLVRITAIKINLFTGGLSFNANVVSRYIEKNSGDFFLFYTIYYSCILNMLDVHGSLKHASLIGVFQTCIYSSCQIKVLNAYSVFNCFYFEVIVNILIHSHTSHY